MRVVVRLTEARGNVQVLLNRRRLRANGQLCQLSSGWHSGLLQGHANGLLYTGALLPEFGSVGFVGEDTSISIFSPFTEQVFIEHI